MLPWSCLHLCSQTCICLGVLNAGSGKLCNVYVIALRPPLLIMAGSSWLTQASQLDRHSFLPAVALYILQQACNPASPRLATAAWHPARSPAPHAHLTATARQCKASSAPHKHVPII